MGKTIKAETKEWEPPKGYEIDREQSNEQQIVLKKIENKRVSSWQEYCKKMQGKNSYCFGNNWKIYSSTFGRTPALSEFEDKEDSEALIAFVKLLKMRKDWVGDWKSDWESDKPKFIIVNNRNNIEDSIAYHVNSPMTFPTAAMRDEFITTFRDLLEQAKPLL